MQRFVLLKGFSDKIELYLFCDASEKAYVAESHGQRESFFLVAKTKEARVKTQCFPRLEFCAASLVTKVFQSVINSIAQTLVVIEEIIAFADSTIVLCWLSKEPSRKSTHVSNRITNFQSKNMLNWNHVCSNENPADTDAAFQEFTADQRISTIFGGEGHIG